LPQGESGVFEIPEEAEKDGERNTEGQEAIAAIHKAKHQPVEKAVR
jgi:hypothetical protein